MGCGNVKQSAHPLKSLQLENVGVNSIDSFNNKVSDIINRFADLTDDLEKRKNEFFDQCDLVYANRTKDRTLSIAFQATVLFIMATIEGDVEKVKIHIIDEKPYFRVDFSEVATALEKPTALLASFAAIVEAIE